MNIGDFFHSKRWRTTQNYIYSWGASVVLIGALFKLEHLPGASAFLGVGLSIEALIFFISAFEPLMETPDWKKVYPQLRTKEDKGYSEDAQQVPLTLIPGGKPSKGPVAIESLSEEQITSLNESLQKLTETAKGLQNITKASEVSAEFVTNLDKASKAVGEIVDANKKISDEMEKGGKEISQSYISAAKLLVSSTEKVTGDMSQSISDTFKTVAGNMATSTEKISKEMSQSISDSYQSVAGKLVASSEKIANEMNQSISELTGSYKNTAEAISTSGKKVSKEMEQSAQNFNSQLISSSETLKKSYKEMTETLTGGFRSLDKNSSKYIDNIEKINKNLAALNAVYEIQLQGATKVETMVGDYSKGVSEVNKLIQQSIEETKKYNNNTKEITENIGALNKVYGNMLGALNVKK